MPVGLFCPATCKAQTCSTTTPASRTAAGSAANRAVQRRVADRIATPHQVTIDSPTPGMAENRLVMTVAAQKLICPGQHVAP